MIKKKAKDYSQYFDFTDARIVSEDDEKKVVKIKGREITIYDQPNYRSGRKRKREGVQVLRPEKNDSR